MRWVSLPLIVIGLAIELLAAWLFVTGIPIVIGPALAVATHIVAVAFLTLGVFISLPLRYRAPAFGAAAYIALSALLLPVIGPLGLVLAVLGGLYWPYREKPRDWDALEIPELPFQLVEIDSNDVLLRDGVMSVLGHFDDRNRRQQAIMVCRHLPHRQAVPILRSALGDSVDEVRLLAYAMLNSIERDLEHKLMVVEQAIEEGSDSNGELHEETAQLYWEFSYLQLANPSVEALMLSKAISALDIALQRRPTAQRYLLRARACLALKSYDKAVSALRNAEAIGIDADDSAPWWAELAFKRRQFDKVAPALRRMSADAGANPVMHPVLEYWL